MKFWLLILGGSLLEVLGDVFLKKQMMMIGLSVYFLGSYLWALSLKESELSKAIVIFTVINLLMVVGIGATYFNESLSVQQLIGVGFAIPAIFLMS